jgi:hypothetical protein
MFGCCLSTFGFPVSHSNRGLWRWSREGGLPPRGSAWWISESHSSWARLPDGDPDNGIMRQWRPVDPCWLRAPTSTPITSKSDGSCLKSHSRIPSLIKQFLNFILDLIPESYNVFYKSVSGFVLDFVKYLRCQIFIVGYFIFKLKHDKNGGSI